MKELKVYREKIYPQGGNYRFGWYWHYFTESTGKTSRGADKRLEENSLVELRSMAKRRGYKLVETF